MGKSRLTPFMLWAKTVRPQMEEQNGGIDFNEVKTRLGEMWGNLSDSEKYSWKRRAQQLSSKPSNTGLLPVASQSKGNLTR